MTMIGSGRAEARPTRNVASGRARSRATAILRASWSMPVMGASKPRARRYAASTPAPHPRSAIGPRALPFRAGAGQEHLEAVLPQRRGEHAAQREIVIDDEDPLPLHVSGAFRAGRFSGLRVFHEPGHSKTLRPTCRSRARLKPNP